MTINWAESNALVNGWCKEGIEGHYVKEDFADGTGICFVGKVGKS